MANLKQNDDGSMGIEGTDAGQGGFVNVSLMYNASSVDFTGFVATRSYTVKGITHRVEAAGTDAGAVTVAVKKAASGTAIASGTALHSGTGNLKGTAATNQTLTISTTVSDLLIPAGTAIGLDFTGVLTNATGVVTVTLAPN
jgi:hypothetical protein